MGRMLRGIPRWRVVVFLVAVVVVAAVVVVLVANDDKSKSCESAPARHIADAALPNIETFSSFIATQEEGPLPLTPWSLTSETGGESVYTSDANGHWTVNVSEGSVSYTGCPR